MQGSHPRITADLVYSLNHLKLKINPADLTEKRANSPIKSFIYADQKC